MILAYAPDPKHVELLGRFRPMLRLERDWSGVEGCVATARCLVLMVEELSEPSLAEGMRRIRMRAPHLHSVMVTSPNPENARHLGAFEVDAVLWTGEIEDLSEVLRRGGPEGHRVRIARALLERPALSKNERRILAVLMETDPPPRSCGDWAKAAFVSESTIRYHLRKRLTPGGLPSRLLLNLNLFLAALERVPGARRWSDLGATVAVDPRRLRSTVAMLGRAPRSASPTEAIGPSISKFLERLDAAVTRGPRDCQSTISRRRVAVVADPPST